MIKDSVTIMRGCFGGCTFCSIDPNLRVLDLWNDFTNSDGTLKKDLFTSDNIHLSSAGYAVYAEKLKPFLNAFFSGKQMPVTPSSSTVPSKTSEAPFPEKPADSKPRTVFPNAASGARLPAKPVLTYAYLPYNEGKLDRSDGQAVCIDAFSLSQTRLHGAGRQNTSGPRR